MTAIKTGLSSPVQVSWKNSPYCEPFVQPDSDVDPACLPEFAAPVGAVELGARHPGAGGGVNEFTIAHIDADMIETAIDLEEDQITFDQILLGNAGAFMDLGAGITGSSMPTALRNTSRAKAEQSIPRWLLPPMR